MLAHREAYEELATSSLEYEPDEVFITVVTLTVDICRVHVFSRKTTLISRQIYR